MRFKQRAESPLSKKARRGFRGYPVATIAFYGPDNQRASKVAVGILTKEDSDPEAMHRWYAQSEDQDLRFDSAVEGEILQFITHYGVKTVTTSSGIIGCPHEEGLDYPEGEVCPQCPFWAHRDRWTGELIQ